MRDDGKWALAALAILTLVIGPMDPAGAAGKIVCWKDKSGKILGCGDTVPPEYRNNATNELDKSGVTRRSRESADEAARRRSQEAELVKQKADEERKLTEQRRQDAALLGTFSNDREIDAKRDREVQVVDLRMDQLKGSLKNAHTDADKQQIQQSIAANYKEREEIQKQYAAYKKRFLELKGVPGSVSAPSPAAARASKK